MEGESFVKPSKCKAIWKANIYYPCLCLLWDTESNTVCAFNLTICLRMITRGQEMFDFKNITETIDKIVHEWVSPIRDKRFWTTKSRKYIFIETFCNFNCFLRVHWKNFYPFSEGIDNLQNILMSLSCFVQFKEVYVPTFKTTNIWEWSQWWWTSMSVMLN